MKQPSLLKLENQGGMQISTPAKDHQSAGRRIVGPGAIPKGYGQD
jgi:hypothetical protein